MATPSWYAIWCRAVSFNRTRARRTPADDAVTNIAGGRCDEIPHDAAAGGRSPLSEDSGFVEYNSSDHRALEASVPAASHRRSDGGVASRPAAVRKDAEVAGQGAGRDQRGTEGWFH